MTFFKRKTPLHFFNKLILVLNACAAIALSLSYLAPIADPASWWLIAAMGLGYTVLLYVNMLFVLYWLLLRRIHLFFSLICILLGFSMLTSQYGFRLPVHAIEGPEANIRVMSYNVHSFRALDKYIGTRIPDKMIGVMDSLRPDILNVLEFNSQKTDNGANYALKKRMGLPYHHFWPWKYNVWDSTGVALFSRYPIIRTGAIIPPRSAPEMEAVYMDVRIRNQLVRVYCIHLQSVHFGQKEHRFLKGENVANKGKLFGIKLITRKLKQAFILRSYQAQTVKQHLDSCPYPFILTGDFNDTPISFAVNKIAAGLTNTFKEKGSGSGITYHNDFPNVQIDYIFTSRHFNVLSNEIVHNKLSDHYPVVSTVQLKR